MVQCLSSLPKLTKSLLLFFLITFTGCDSYSTLFSPTVTRKEEAIDFAKQNLPSEGRLEQGKDGFVYLKVSNQYVHRLFPMIKEPGFKIPSSVERHTKTGAHISVIYKQEAQSIGKIHEIGQKFSFEQKSIDIVRAGNKEYMILIVKAPQLESLREQYGLTPLLNGHEFHITLAERNIKRFRKTPLFQH